MNGKHVFAVGTGRCGTKTVVERFSWMTPEARHEGWHYRKGEKTRLPKFRHLIQGRPSPEWNRESIKKRWEYLRAKPHSFEAGHYFTQSLDWVMEMFPQVKFLHLVRPAPEVVYSFLRWSRDSCYRLGGAHDWGREPNKDAWIDWCDSFPEFPGVDSRIAGYAMHWQWTNRALERVGVRLGDRYKQVWLTDLNDPEKWEEVVRFVDPPNPCEVELHAANKNRKPFIPDEAGEVEKVCKEVCTWRPSMMNGMSGFPGQNSNTELSGT